MEELDLTSMEILLDGNTPVPPARIRELIAEVRRLKRPFPKWDGRLYIHSDAIIDGKEYKAGDVLTLTEHPDGLFRPPA